MHEKNCEIELCFYCTIFSKRGFPDTTATNGLVSSILALPFALGNAFGPAASSALYEAVGFEYASLAVIGLSCCVVSECNELLYNSSNLKI